MASSPFRHPEVPLRILITGVNFAPERTGIAPYTAALARHLAERHDVTVVTSVPHYPDWRVDKADRVWRKDEHDGTLRIIRLNHYVPHRLNIASRLAFEATFAARATLAGMKIPTDLVLAVVPALLGVYGAREIARRNGAPLGVIVQDVMGDAAAQAGLRGGHLISRGATAVERRALRSADAVSTIHPRLASEIQRSTGVSANVIYNWTHVRARPRPGSSLRARLGWRDDEVIALHSGNMGAKQNLEVVIDAARAAQRENRSVRFVLCGGGSQRRALEHYAQGCANVSFQDSVGDDDYMDLLASADVLLVNERPGMNQMSLPSKLTSYLVAGRPVVAATDTTSGTAEFVRRSGGGIVTPAGDSQCLLDTVDKIAADEPLARRLADDGRIFAETNLSVDEALAAYDSWIEGLTAAAR